MDSNAQGARPGDDPKLLAKLRGLERMFVAGLIDDRTYQVKSRELQEQLERGPGPSAAPSRPVVPAPPPLVAGPAPSGWGEPQVPLTALLPSEPVAPPVAAPR